MDFNLNNFTRGKSRNLLKKKKKSSQRLTQSTKIYLSSEEKAKLDQLADDEGLKLSVFLRRVLKKENYI